MKENTYDFINSRDIREFLRQQAFQFDPLQCAYLVWQSKRHTLKEKHAAWREIIDTLPDMAVPGTPWCAGWDSLHGMLRDYMAMEEKYLARFQEREANAVYTYMWREDGNWRGEGCLYTQSFQACFDKALRDCPAYGDRFRIKKQYFENPDGVCHISVEYRRSGVVMSIGVCGDVPERTEEELNLSACSFEGLWYDIPIPFRKGDIVCGGADGVPFVLESTVPWYRRERGLGRTDGDITDMISGGACYDQCAGGLVTCDGTPYLDLEYYRGELTGGERILEAYSQHVKGEMDALTLIHFHRLYEAEAFAEKERESLSWFFVQREYQRKNKKKEAAP